MRSQLGRRRPAPALLLCSALAMAACASSATASPSAATTPSGAATAGVPTDPASQAITTVPSTTLSPATAPPATLSPTTLLSTSVPPTSVPPTSVPPSTTEPATGRVTMAFTGDVLAHRVINRAALQPDGSYDYTSMLANIAPLVSAADIAVCHLEAPIAPPGQQVMVEPQRVSSAASITNALAFAGFDRCSTASNHSVDRGAAGVDATVTAFEAAGMGQSGVARSEAERLPALMTVNGVKVAHLAYSYGFDGTPLPAGEPWRANIIDPAVIIADARAERALGAEVVVVSLHWGASMASNPTADQQRVAEAVTASGDVNLIVGHHSHVIQPISQVNGVWVVWGMSNFLSALPTSDQWPAKSQDGVLVSVTFNRADDGSIVVSRPSVRPTWCDKGNGYVVRSTAEQNDPTLSPAVREQLRISEERTRDVLGEFIPA